MPLLIHAVWWWLVGLYLGASGGVPLSMMWWVVVAVGVVATLLRIGGGWAVPPAGA